MDESGLEGSLSTYKTQLDQVESALRASGEETNDDLVKLQTDIKQLIDLTEASLLSFKKSKLLSLFDNESSVPGDKPESSNVSGGVDAEYAAFQAAIAGEPSQSNPGDAQEQNDRDLYDDGPQTGQQDQTFASSADGNVADISGTKCCVPYSHEWGEAGLHNAMIVDVETLEEQSEPQVRVLFSHPTHQSMIPCPFFLEGSCRFDEDKCRYSHGYIVNVCDLQEFKEPDYSLIGIDKKCLAKTEKNIWCKGRVVDILENHLYQVMFDHSHKMATVSLEDIYPQDESDGLDSDSDADHSSGEESPLQHDSDNSESELPVYLWRPGQSTEEMGSWEIHTRGIGSMLMQKMGYITGQGLGKNSDGRADPVPIQLLPSGKSLDKIMELKDIAGDRDLYDVMKKRKKKQKKVEEKAAKSYNKVKPANVFDFINKKLGKHKGNLKNLAKTSNTKKNEPVKHITHRDLKEKSDKSINIQLLQTHEEMNKVQKEISKLKTALTRNEGRDPGMAKQIRTKMSNMEKYLNQLKSSENSIQSHKKVRSDNKKLTVF